MTADYETQCTWPNLAEPFASALRDAVDFIFQEFEPVGVIAAGTIVRGTAHPSSDLDLYVVHGAPYRRRVQRFFRGVPTEIFVNPPAAVRGYFADEDRDGRRLTAHMLATGAVIFSNDAVVDTLRAEAAHWLEKETLISEFERVSSRYTIASRLEDGLDVLGSDDVTASMLLSEAVLAMLEFTCRADSGKIPRRKDLLAVIAARQPEVAGLAAQFFRATAHAERARIAVDIADRTIGARGFFPWDSGAGPVP
jgi:predicted nucleotidyltransferase